MQFHCEVDDIKVREWLISGATEIQACASRSVGRVEDILRSLDSDLAHSQRIASHTYQRWAIGLKH